MQLTSNLNLKKPESTDNVNIDDLNGNADILDVEVMRLASVTEAGRMSAADKLKLNGIAAGAQVNAVTSVAGKTGAVTLTKADVGLGNVDNVQQAPISHVGAGGTAHAPSTASTAGFMSAADKTKLDGVAAGAQVNRVIASQAQAEAGTDNTTDMTPLRVAQAITALAPSAPVQSVAGKTGAVTLVKGDVGLGNVDNVQQAPITHVGAGGNGAHPDATTSTSGFMTATMVTKLNGVATGAQVNRSIATQIQAEAGTDNTTDMTPLRTMQNVDARSDIFRSRGGFAETGDYDTYTINGIWQVGVRAGKVNGPPATTDYGLLEVVKDGAYLVQRYTEIVKGTTYQRTNWDGSSWSVWKQTGGGGVVERYGYSGYLGGHIPAGTPVRLMNDGTIASLPLNTFGSKGVSTHPSLGNIYTNGGIMGQENVSADKNLITYCTNTALYAVVFSNSSLMATIGTRLTIVSGTLAGVDTANGPAGSGEAPTLFSLGSSRYLQVFIESGLVKGVVLTVSGTNVSMGSVITLSATALESSIYRYLRIVPLNTSGTKFLMLFQTVAGQYVLAFSISGTNITVGTAVQLSTQKPTAALDAAYVTTDRAMVAYCEYSNSSDLAYITVSSNIVTIASKLTYYSGSQNWNVTLQAFTSTMGLVFFGTTNGSVFQSRGITISGTTMSLAGYSKSGLVYSSYAPAKIIPLGNSGSNYFFAVASWGSGSSFSMNVSSITAAGGPTGIADGTEFSIFSGRVGHMLYDSVTNKFFCLGVTSANIAFSVISWTPWTHSLSKQADNVLNSLQGVYSSRSTRRCFVPFSSSSFLYVDGANVDTDNIFSIVISKSAMSDSAFVNSLLGTKTSSGSVVLKGLGDSYSGLIPGGKYYLDPSGNLTLTAGTNTYFGLALSETEILIPEFLF